MLLRAYRHKAKMLEAIITLKLAIHVHPEIRNYSTKCFPKVRRPHPLPERNLRQVFITDTVFSGTQGHHIQYLLCKIRLFKSTGQFLLFIEILFSFAA